LFVDILKTRACIPACFKPCVIAIASGRQAFLYRPAKDGCSTGSAVHPASAKIAMTKMYFINYTIAYADLFDPDATVTNFPLPYIIASHAALAPGSVD